MGDLLDIKCSCGFEIKNIGVGGGMNGVSQLYTCKKCQKFDVTFSSMTYEKCNKCSTSLFKKLFPFFFKNEQKEKEDICSLCNGTGEFVNFSDYKKECSECKNEIEFIDEELLNEFPCPQCNEKKIKVSNVGIWD